MISKFNLSPLTIVIKCWGSELVGGEENYRIVPPRRKVPFCITLGVVFEGGVILGAVWCWVL